MQASRPHETLRSCAACRARVPREMLLRFVETPEGIAFDPTRLRAGRGLNVGPSPICLERAVKRGAFQRQWRRSVSSEELAVLVAQVREASRDGLQGYLLALTQRGGMEAVANPEEVSPAEMRTLWEDDPLREVVTGVERGRVKSARAAAKIKAMMCVVSEFTFTRAGAIKRRLESSEACEALERCGGGELRGSAKARRVRAGAASLHAMSDGRDG